MSVHLTAREISRGYDRFAPWYDLVEGIPDFLGVRTLRRQLMGRGSGAIIEVAAGTGKNLPYYPAGSKVTAVDISREMLKLARQRAAQLSIEVTFLLADATALPFPDNSFDTVVTSLSTCTFPEPVAALKEIRRVCRPAGRVLLLEHGRSDRERIGRWQDRHADKFAKPLGCHWDRKPLELTRAAGLKIIEAKRSFFGVFHLIEAEPADPKC